MDFLIFPKPTELQKDNILIALENVEYFKKGYYKYKLLDSARKYNFPRRINTAYYWGYRSKYCLYSQNSIHSESFLLPKDKIYFTLKDSISAAEELYNPLIMNLANAYHPGGGFLYGKMGQEEDLCRRSSLYASLASNAASRFFYTPHKRATDAIDTEQILFSPYVCVFRDRHLKLLPDPFFVSICSVAAPNKNNLPATITQDVFDYLMKNRLRKLFKFAPLYNYNALILGAWGCGAFGHSPQEVANYFYELLIEENYLAQFNRIVFAFKNDYEKFTIFKERFAQGSNVFLS